MRRKYVYISHALISSRIYVSALPIRFENGAAESADDGFPGPPVEGDMAEPGGCDHVGHARPAAAPGAKPGHRLALLHPPLLVHQETETHHILLHQIIENGDGSCGENMRCK